MPLKGNIEEIPLFDVIQMLALGKRTGVLYIKGARYAAKIYFRKGRIVFARLLGGKIEKIGEILVRKGYLTQKKLNMVLDKYIGTDDFANKKLGEILVSLGILTYDIIEKAVTYQIEETIFEVLTETMGTYSFNIEPIPEGEDIFIDKSAESILIEAVRRIDEWKKIKEKIPSMSKRYRIARKLEAKNININFTFEEWKVFVNMTGDKTLEQIAAITKVDTFLVAKIAYFLLGVKIIELADDVIVYGVAKKITDEDIYEIRKFLEERV